jgi:hypothetical protein
VTLFSHSQQKRAIISLRGIQVILPIMTDNPGKIIKIAKHPAYSHIKFSEQQA